MITEEIRQYIDQSVLCWLATASSDNFPNVSPKEVFMADSKDNIIIANIASPQTIRNIRQNEKVCVSFIDVLVQKGFQLKGKAKIITSKDDSYLRMKTKLEQITKGKFPFSSITKIYVEKAKQILAPSYLLFPETTEKDQIENARMAYGFKN